MNLSSIIITSLLLFSCSNAQSKNTIDNGKYLATTAKGSLVELKSDNTTAIIGDYPKTAFYLSVPQQDNITCISPNLTKLANRPGKCLRKGQQYWEVDGEWRDVLHPFLCANYLIETTGNWNSGNVTGLQVRDIQTGKVLTKKSINNLESATCVQNNVLFIDSKIQLAKLPEMDVNMTSDCGSPHPRSATRIDDKIVCLDRKGKLSSK